MPKKISTEKLSEIVGKRIAIAGIFDSDNAHTVRPFMFMFEIKEIKEIGPDPHFNFGRDCDLFYEIICKGHCKNITMQPNDLKELIDTGFNMSRFTFINCLEKMHWGRSIKTYGGYVMIKLSPKRKRKS